MIIRKDLVVAVLLTFCLSATLFSIISTKSQYDPWTDLNDDGVIDSTDLGTLGTGWGTFGDPAKNVNITGHGSTLMYHTTNLYVDVFTYWNSSVYLVDGYSKFSISMCYEDLANVQFMLYCGYYDDLSALHEIPTDLRTLSGSYFVRTYDVTNPYMRIYIINQDVSAHTIIELTIYALA